MAKRYYVIPMAYPATDIEKELQNFSVYGVGVLDIFASVWRSIIDDDHQYHLDVSNYIARAVKQQWHDNRLRSQGGEPAMQAEIDDMTRKCIDVCDSIFQHIQRFMDIIQEVENKSAGFDFSYWGIHDTSGNDIIVVCEDPSATPKTDLYISSDMAPVQLK